VGGAIRVKRVRVGERKVAAAEFAAQQHITPGIRLE
jgi:hypothetical protein